MILAQTLYCLFQVTRRLSLQASLGRPGPGILTRQPAEKKLNPQRKGAADSGRLPENGPPGAVTGASFRGASPDRLPFKEPLPGVSAARSRLGQMLGSLPRFPVGFRAGFPGFPAGYPGLAAGARRAQGWFLGG